MLKKYTLRKQGGNKGYYVELLFEVISIDSLGSAIEIEYLADPKWEIICKAGILLFHEYFTTKMKRSLNVRIHEIKWIPVDTNSLLVLYSCVAALSEALGLSIEGFSFDIHNAEIIFPERRKFMQHVI